jgi:hypothetical protein
VHGVDALGPAPVDDLELLLEDLAVLLVVLDGVDADPQRDLGTDPGPDDAQALPQQAGPALDGVRNSSSR